MILYLKNYKKKILVSIFLMFALSFLSNMGPYIVKLIVDVGIKEKNIVYITRMSLIAIGLYILYSVGNTILSYSSIYISERINLDIKKAAYQKIMLYPMSFFDSKQKGYVLGRTYEIESIKPLFSSIVWKLIMGGVEFVLAVVFMINISIPLTIVAIAILPIYYIFISAMAKKMNFLIEKNMEKSAKTNGVVQQIINGIEEIKISNREKSESKKIDYLNKKITVLSIKQGLLMNATTETIILLCNIISVLILLIFSIFITKDQMTMGAYLAYSGYLPKVLIPAQTLSVSLIGLQPAWRALNRVASFFGEEVDEEKGLPQIKITEGRIELKDISFKYNEEDEFVLHNLSMKVTPKSKVLLHGANGSGKTTIIKLLVGLYTDYTGEILIDENNIRKFQKSSIRSQISIISQNVFLFSGTLKDNILYCVEQYTDHDLYQALSISGLLETFDKGILNLESNIGENGILLSGGQRQMIAIARAIMKKSKILIFDEATSNLDSIKTERLYSILNKSFTNSTCLVISHDIINHQYFDDIITL